MKLIYKYEAEGPNNRLYEKDGNMFPRTILGNLINCTINLIYDVSLQTRDFTEFYQLFYMFAKLGPEIVNYLIDCHLIGIFMDNFYESASPYKEIFKNMSNLKFKEPETFFLGRPQKEKHKTLTALDEILQKRKQRTLMERFSIANRVFMWKTIAYLISFTRLSKCPQRFIFLKNKLFNKIFLRIRKNLN